jgi:tRNA pseudouridine38-40 synthase
MRYRLILSYDGGCFNGWQKQIKGPATVQGTLEQILQQILRQPIRVVGSGRTDTGVHALVQVAHFDSDKELGPRFLHSLNALAPEGLVIRSVARTPDDFHARVSCVEKTYLYRIWNAPLPSVSRRHWSLHVQQPIDIKKLNDLSQILVGHVDFKSFQTRGTPVLSTIRHVSQAEWRHLSKHMIEFRITGEGFLKQMVRNIVGTLLYLERKNLSLDDLKAILAASDRQAAKDTAPPHGLYLYQVKYPSALDNQCRKI